MNGSAVIFAADRGPWRVGVDRQERCLREVPVAADAESDALAAATAEALREAGWVDGPVVLALPSSWCLVAEIATDGLSRGGRERAMTFRLEEHLPLSAEDMVADFIEVGKGSALGVAAGLDRIEQLLTSFESVGVTVGSIVPLAFLAAQAAVSEAGAIDAIVVAQHPDESDGPATFDWIELHKGRPVGWRWFADDRSALIEAIDELRAARQPARVLAIGAIEPAALGIETVPEVEWLADPADSALDRALSAAGGVLDHSDRPWVELRRGPVALPSRGRACRGPLVAMVTAAAVLLATLTGVLTWRGMQYDELAGRYRREQTRVFREAIPDQRPPMDILGRLRSEYRKLAGIGGETLDDDASAAALPTSALVHLRDMLAHLPGSIRFRILNIDITPEGMEVRGQAKSYAEAEQIAAGLRGSGRYTVEMHEINRLREGGVGFRFAATPKVDRGVVR